MIACRSSRRPALAPVRVGLERVESVEFLPGVGQGRIHMRLKASGVADLHVQVVLYKVKNTGVKIPLDRNS